VATIIENGIRRMTGPEPEDRIWYLTLYNENYPMPALPSDPAEAEKVRLGTIKGMYRFAPGGSGSIRASVLFSGSAWQAAAGAQRLLATDWGVDADLWSVTSYKSLREDAISVERWNRLHPGGTGRTPFVTEQLAGSQGPIVAVSDFMRAVPDQVSRWMPRPFTSLGTDGFGRSDTRDVLRRFFEVDAEHVVVAVLHSLVAEGSIPPGTDADAIERYGIDPAAADPWSS
jgi:pyruvate dehydrogenase E1 component